MGFRLQHNSMTLNDLGHQFTDVVSFMRVATMVKAWSRGFHYKVAVSHSYLPIKFDDDIQGGHLI